MRAEVKVSTRVTAIPGADVRTSNDKICANLPGGLVRLAAVALILLATPAWAQTPRGTSLLPGDVVLNPATPTPPATGLPGEGPRLHAISVIVIDAGHGGDDTGVRASVSTPLAEKDLSLDIAKKIEATLTAQTGARVLLTRSGDVHLGIADRASFANEARADLFLSIHANGSPAESAHGFRLYYHDAPGAEASASPAPATPWSEAQRESEEKSARFAELLRESLAAKVSLTDRGVKRAPMTVLEGATCPAALIEVGFLSNKDEALALSTGAVQDAIAEAVADAVLRMDATLGEGTP